jgi:hypothetical protein
VSKEGVASFWNSEMTVQKTVTLDYPKHKKMWVTDCVALSNVNKIAVATTDNDICKCSNDIGNMQFKLKFLETDPISVVCQTVICLLLKIDMYIRQTCLWVCLVTE